MLPNIISRLSYTIILISLTLLTQSQKAAGQERFELILSKDAKLLHENLVVPDGQHNVFSYVNFYNGSGLAVGDLDGDGLEDLFLGGNQVDDVLYRNLGELKFEQLQKASLTGWVPGWTTGVSMVDINGDGLLDIYVCRGGAKPGEDASRNLLFINQGNLQFNEAGNEYGLDHLGNSIAAAFLDYDKDGDLDVYLINEPFTPPPRVGDNPLETISEDSVIDHKELRKLADSIYPPQYIDFEGKVTKLDHLALVEGNTGLVRDRGTGEHIGYASTKGPKNQPAKEVRKIKGQERTNKKPVSEPGKPAYAKPLADFKDNPLALDQLLLNDRGKFRAVGKAAGIDEVPNAGLSVVTSDLNDDGWMDIYVANDFFYADMLYLNQQDGSFTNVALKQMQHHPLSSMGSDAADINNDGLMDIVAVEMSPSDHYRAKTNMPSMQPESFEKMIQWQGIPQYMSNTVQLNTGDAHFSEIGHLAGVTKTDWSWAPLIADLDNDGFKDLYITNGYPIDMLNNDFLEDFDFNEFRLNLLEENDQHNEGTSYHDYEHQLQASPIANFCYQNQEGLRFRDVGLEWGLALPSYSNAAAYADLDLDGDLDLIIGNINAAPFLYENKSEESKNSHHLQVQLIGPGGSLSPIGAKVEIRSGKDIQVAEFSPSRGFLSNSSTVMHFGLGRREKIDELIVTWPDGKMSNLGEQSGDQRLVLAYDDVSKDFPPAKSSVKQLVKEIAAMGNESKHLENEFNDFDRETLLPHELSREGPGIAVGDLDGDGTEDFVLCGAMGQPLQVEFVSSDPNPSASDDLWEADKDYEDVAIALFDSDGDEDLDLYVVSGGNERTEGSTQLRDRLYLNDGSGNFSRAESVLPDTRSSGSCVQACDFDKDGDVDLFVGTRSIPGKYPSPASSSLLLNQREQFVEAAYQFCPALDQIGMVTDMLWTDFNGDGWQDMIIVGEWMSIRLFANQDGKSFKEVSHSWGMSETTGWWNSLAEGDFDGDGDMDYIAGNLGLNMKFKADDKQGFQIHANDFDGSGNLDIVLSVYKKGEQALPVRGRECSSEQMPFLIEKFPTYHDFASASLAEIYGEDELASAIHYEADILSTVYLENKDGRLIIRELPIEAQFGPVMSILPDDIDKDGDLDLLMVGNYQTFEVETVQADSFPGLIALNDGHGNFESLSPRESGFRVFEDARSIERLVFGDQKFYLIGVNDGPTKTFRLNAQE